MLLYDVAVAHCDDWFWFAVPPAAESEPSAAATGVVIKLGAVTVSDSFDEEWPLDPPDPATWALFHTAGRPPTDLVVWPVAVAPHSGPLLDDIALGVDEDANLAWAVELRVDGTDLLDDFQSAQALQDVTRTGSRDFTYRPSSTLPPHWHAYERVRDTDEDAAPGSGDGRSGPYRQAIVADLNHPSPPTHSPAPASGCSAAPSLPAPRTAAPCSGWNGGWPRCSDPRRLTCVSTSSGNLR